MRAGGEFAGGLVILVAFDLVACGSRTGPRSPDAAITDTAESDVPAADVRTCQAADAGPAPAATFFCDLGTPVMGAVVPAGFCLRRFATIAAARTLTFAANGDLFVAAPQTPTPGGAPPGRGAIFVVTDANHDGTGELHTFADAIPDVHGVAIGEPFLYFTTSSDVWRTPYANGQCAERRDDRHSFGAFHPGRWTHGLARSPTGIVYASEGVESAACSLPIRAGAVHRADVTGLTSIAVGLRNPMYVRCRHDDETCAATETGDDAGEMFGAHEKILLLETGTDYGFPCCAGPDLVAPGNTGQYDCRNAEREQASLPLHTTPFGLDWERGTWPEPYRNAMFVALHGSFSWAGARVVFARTDARAHAPIAPWQDFVTGFGPGGSMLERPADIAFSADGRMFFADDQAGAVYWIAPTTSRIPGR